MGEADEFRIALHKKWSFPLRTSSVNVTKSLMENFVFCAVLVFLQVDFVSSFMGAISTKRLGFFSANTLQHRHLTFLEILELFPGIYISEFFHFTLKYSDFFLWSLFICNLRELSIARLCCAFAWNSFGYDIKRPGKYWFMIEFAPDF